MGFYDNFKLDIKPEIKESPDGLESNAFINDYLDEYYNLNNLKAGLEDDDPFEGIAPEDVAIDDNPDAGGSDDPFSMDNNELGSDELGGDPFSNLVDEGAGDDGGFGDEGDPNEQTDEQNKNNDQLKVDREKLLRASYSLGANIRKIFPPRFNELKEILSSNIESLSQMEFHDPNAQDVLLAIVKQYEKQIELIKTFQDIIIDQPFDVIFRKYVEIFTNCMKLKEAYNVLKEEDANYNNKGKNKYKKRKYSR